MRADLSRGLRDGDDNLCAFYRDDEGVSLVWG